MDAMKPRKYQDIRVINEVYVSSSFHHFFRVVMKQVAGDKRLHVTDDYGFEFAEPFEHRRYPKYVLEATERAILELLKSGKAVFHEYDRDGCKRYEDLRYHDDESVKWMIEVLEAKYGEVQTTEV